MQGPDEPGLQSSRQAPWNTAPGRGRGRAGAGETDDRSEVHQAAPGARGEAAPRSSSSGGPPARARSSSLGLSSTGPGSLPPQHHDHTTTLPQICPRKVPPRRHGAQHAATIRGAGSQVLAAREPLVAPPRPGTPAGPRGSPRFSVARRSSSRDLPATSSRRERAWRERLGRAFQPGPRLGGRAAGELRSCTNTAGLRSLHTPRRGAGCGPGGGGRRRPPAAAPAAAQAAEVGLPEAPARAELQPPPARSPPGVPWLAAPPAGLDRPRSNTPLTQLPPGLRPQQSPFLPPRAAALGRLRGARPLARTPGFLKTNRRRRLPRGVRRALAKARSSRSWEVCWQGPGGTCVLSPAARDTAASARPAPFQSASRALSLPACHPQSCDAVSGLHDSDSSVELTA